MKVKPQKVRTVIYLPDELIRRFRHGKADTMVPVTTQIESILTEHFTRQDRGKRRAERVAV